MTENIKEQGNRLYIIGDISVIIIQNGIINFGTNKSLHQMELVFHKKKEHVVEMLGNNNKFKIINGFETNYQNSKRPCARSI